MTSPSLMLDPQSSQVDSSWPAFWRQVLASIPATCLCHENQLEAMAPEWQIVFDRFSNISAVNKFIASGGEGSAKSHSLGLFGVCRYLYDYLTVLPRPELYWVIGETFEDAFKEFSYIEEFLGLINRLQMGTDKKGNAVVIGRTGPSGGKDQCILTTKEGVKFVTVSAGEPKKIAREEPDGIIGSELSLWSQEAKERSYTRIARKPSAWFFGAGSPESDQGWFQSEVKVGEGPNGNRLASTNIPAFANLHVYPGGRDDPRILERQASMSPERFSERILGIAMPPKGLVMTGFSTARHVNTSLEIDPSLPMYLFVDPGDLVYDGLFVQITLEGQVNLLNEFTLSAMNEHPSHQDVVRTAQMCEEWKYLRADGHVMDVAGGAHIMGNDPAAKQWKDSTGISFNLIGHLEERDKIERLRSLFNVNQKTGLPFLQVSPKCREFIAECGGGPSPTAEQGRGPWMRHVSSDGTVGKAQARNNHACDALAYGMTYHRGPARPGRRRGRGATQYRTGGFAGGREQTPLDYQAFPNTTHRRSDGTTVTVPGKRFSELSGRRKRAY